MHLLTFGQLALRESDFSRAKPLLLLTYLSLASGALERRHVAELFWHGKSDHLNSLSSALNQLRRLVPGSVEADEVRVWTSFQSDAHELEDAFAKKDLERVIKLYKGPFLETVNASRLGEELETWVLETREALASKVQDALLQLAELKATKALFAESAELAERAYRLPGAFEPEPEQLGRYFTLLVAGESSFADTVREEAEGFGVSLSASQEDAKARLQMVLLGRDAELARLSSLDAGSWVWLSGASGMGKTALLKSLSGSLGSSTYIQARKGLPYITLEPYVSDVLNEGEEAILRKLLYSKGMWLTDSWELMDEESQALLVRLRDLRPDLSVVISSQNKAQLSTDELLELRPLKASDLTAYEDAFEKTGGVPALVAAYLRGDSLDTALNSSLSRVSPEARQLYLCLALSDNIELSIIRKALELDAAMFSRALDALHKGGLIDANYAIRAKQAAQDYLETNPVDTTQLALKLARQLQGTAAYPLYEQSKSFWAKDDLGKVKEAYYAWAEALLKRGFPQRAVDVLNESPESDEAFLLLKARALSRTGQNSEALELLEACTATPDTLALNAMLNWRLGSPELAQTQAKSALKGGTHAKASAENVLGHISFAEGKFETAQKHFKKAAVFWQVLGEKGLRAYALSNEAATRYKMGEVAKDAYEKALDAARGNPMVECSILNNLAVYLDQDGQTEQAQATLTRAINLATEVGSLTSAAESWNNLGASYFDQKDEKQALIAYGKALELAQQAEDTSLIALAMANQAEITGDVDVLEAAIELLKSAGFDEDARAFHNLLPEQQSEAT